MNIGHAFDIAGIGALNVDIIAQADTPHPGPESDSESRSDDAEIHELLSSIASLHRRTKLGGSAFNTITGIARAHPGLRLGFVGVAGRTPVGAPRFIEHLHNLGVDTGALAQTSDPAGVCLAIEHAGTRNLRITPSANTSMASHLHEHRAGIVAYLSRFRTVHITSFLDDATPTALLHLVGDLRRDAPDTLVTLDPGHEWCTLTTPAIRGLLALVDVVLLNPSEYAAARIHPELRKSTIVVKSPDGVSIKSAGETEWLDVMHERLNPDEIHQPTGAGDAFAAGFLAALTRRPNGAREAARAGLVQARAHLSGEPARGRGIERHARPGAALLHDPLDE